MSDAWGGARVDEAVLVLAPTAADAALTRRILTEAGLQCQVYVDLSSLCREIERAGAVLLTEEMLDRDGAARLVDALARQPRWSDLPIVLLCGSGADSPIAGWSMECLGNVTVLERPVRLTTMVSALRSALKARRRQYELRDQVEALREADRRKDEFLATLAHELRNPLAPIRNGLQLIAMARNNPDAMDRARAMMERQVIQMVRLIDDLLDVSRITRGTIELRRERLNLCDVLDAAIESSRPALEAAEHSLVVNDPAEAWVEGDRARLVQVFGNLLINAAKFTPRGGHVVLRMCCRAGEVAVSVRDTGVGIAADAQRRIFDLFQQEHVSLARSHGGLGIGLTLVKRLAEMHGGHVDVTSGGLGRGAEFTVTLPLVEPGAAAPPVSPARRETPHGPLQILVVEDNADAAESFKLLLELAGHVVHVARDGFEALRMIERHDPDVAFVDLGLPGIDGFGVAERVRAAGNQRPTLVALSGYGQEEDKRRAYRAGFDVHMTKPVDLDRVETLLVELRGAPVAAERSRAVH